MEKNKIIEEIKIERELWHQEITTLRKELDSQKEENNLLKNESDNVSQAYQKLLQNHNCLERRYETLQKQLNSHNTHTRNISDVSSISTVDDNMLSGLDSPDDHGHGSVRSTSSVVSNAHDRAVEKKEKDYLGMLSFESDDESVIMKHLVIELKPTTAVTLLPGLPAYIVFMCVRHTDYINNEAKVRALLTAFETSIKRVTINGHVDFETLVLWLSNTLRLVHCMKQYSGDESFQYKNTAKQNSQSLRNLDLSEYRQRLSDLAVGMNQDLLRNIREKIQPLIVPAILEHKEVPGIEGNELTGVRGSTSSLRDIDSPGCRQNPIDTLLQELTNHHKILTFYGVDPEVISQIFKQVFYFLSAFSLNTLLFSNRLSWWSKAHQIQHNLLRFEMWTREKQLDEQAVQSTLQPIIQAVQLLQAHKREKDVAHLCEMCSALAPQQMCKILRLCKYMNELYQQASADFIKKVKDKLQERPNHMKQETFTMDIDYLFPVRFPFNPSVICLEDIEIPEVLELGMLEKV